MNGTAGGRRAGAAAAMAAALGMAAACGNRAAVPPFDPADVDGQKAYAEVAALVALGPRDAGTEGAARAADHLGARMRALGLEVETDEFADAVPGGTAVFRNVIARVPGRGRGIVVLGSHYDTKAGVGDGFQGANDSGSSTGLLLELARVMRAAPTLRASIWFVFFDGEEARERYGPRDGLHGSRRLAGRLVAEGRRDDVLGVIVLDMVGDRDLSITLPDNSAPGLVSRVLAAARAEGARSRFALAGMPYTDDHEPFLLAGMPAVDLIDFAFGSAPGRNDYWHTGEDRMDKISPESLRTVGRVAVRVVNGLVAGAPTAP